ncbi:MAG: PQQ-dependent sugar dehydrogenase, partial [Myxococcota bacterium]
PPPDEVDPPSLRVVDEYPDVSFTLPIAAVQHGGSWFVVEQLGTVVRFDPEVVEGRPRQEAVLDLSAEVSGPSLFWEMGMLALAFHPDFDEKPYAYVFYNQGVQDFDEDNQDFKKTPVDVVLARFEVDPVRGLFNPESKKEILRLTKEGLCHNGGVLLFDPDGYLMLSLGDGCGNRDHAQDTQTLLGSVIRIDVDAPDPGRGLPYSIPADNPFVGDDSVAPEIYAYGLRNAWRGSWDEETGALWVGDVGQSEREEISAVQAGGNYEWPACEGTAGARSRLNGPGQRRGPVAEYCRTADQGVAAVGGYVYRGQRIPQLRGTFIFGDAMQGTLFGISAEPDRYQAPTIYGTLGANLAAFAQDDAGELYVLDLRGGKLLALEAGQPVPPPPTPLSAAPFADASEPLQPARGATCYDVNVSFFSDGAQKRRCFMLPSGERLSVDATTGQLEFPVGSTVVKVFERAGRPVETRALIRTAEAGWRGYTYAWRSSGDDADLLAVGALREVAGGLWLYPSRQDCVRCHNGVAGVTLGTTISQLAIGTAPKALFQSWLDAGLLDATEAEIDRLLADHRSFPQLDAAAPLRERARALLDVNCAYCHQPGGSGGGQIDLRASVPLADMGICGVRPQVSTLGIDRALLMAPGEPDRSVLQARLRAEGAERMHPYRLTVDEQAVELVGAWIRETPSCTAN